MEKKFKLGDDSAGEYTRDFKPVVLEVTDVKEKNLNLASLKQLRANLQKQLSNVDEDIDEVEKLLDGKQ